MSTRKDEIFFPVPKECMGRVIGKGGKRINQIKHETRTRIKAVNTASGKECGFLITGTETGREEAKQAIKSYLVSAIIVHAAFLYLKIGTKPGYLAKKYAAQCRAIILRLSLVLIITKIIKI